MSKNLLLTIDHPETKRMEAFLRGVKEPLSITPYNWQKLKLKEEIEASVKLISSSAESLTITIFFCTSYSAANKLAEANNFPNTSTAKWGINGCILYIVESVDSEKVMDVLSHFAGRE